MEMKDSAGIAQPGPPVPHGHPDAVGAAGDALPAPAESTTRSQRDRLRGWK